MFGQIQFLRTSIRMKFLKKTLHKTFSTLGYALLKTDDLKEISKLRAIEREYLMLKNYPETAKDYFKYKYLSKAQLQQDLFVLMFLNFKQNGYFVEFGATDGVSLSNTWLLENEFNWKGILAEPANFWHNSLLQNRNCLIEKRCVWTKTGENLQFREAESISTLKGFGENDGHAALREQGKVYEVETISLMDLLKESGAPEVIDYLSIDTEGSEFEILNAFDFDQYNFRVISVEHNYTSSREQIYELLTKKGYRRLHEEISLFDDWYIWNE